MTFVGKILVIVIMIFAVIFLGISTVVFSTSTDWKKATETARGEVQKQQSKNQELNSPYTHALHTALYAVDKVVSGSLPDKQVLGVQWTFRNKKMEPTASFTAGSHYRLTLVPWETKTELQGINLEETVLAPDLDRWFVEKAEPLP